MLISLLFIFTTLAVADDPDFTIVSIGQPAPFEGVLLSAPAAAEVLAEHEAQKLRCELEIEFQVDKTKTECQLNIDLLNTRIESLNTEYTEVVAQKDLEITELKDKLKKQSPQYKWFWFAGGIVLGGTTYYAIDRAFQ